VVSSILVMIEVELNWVELWLASEIGKLRQFESLRKGLPDKYGFEGAGWNLHILGASGEMAAAKALGIYYGGSVNTFRTQADVGSLEIRTRSKDSYELLVRPDDKDQAIYVHVTGSNTKFKVHGWLFGKEAKEEQYLQTHGGRDPAYFVPFSALKNLSDLKALLKKN